MLFFLQRAVRPLFRGRIYGAPQEFLAVLPFIFRLLTHGRACRIRLLRGEPLGNRWLPSRIIPCEHLKAKTRLIPLCSQVSAKTHREPPDCRRDVNYADAFSVHAARASSQTVSSAKYLIIIYA